MLFTAVGTLILFLLLLGQRLLPGGPPNAELTTPMTADLALNTAVSFSPPRPGRPTPARPRSATGAQLAGLAAQNFLAGAAGLAVGIAFIRGIASERSRPLGNFWVDLVRALLWILLPVSILGSLVLVWRGCR